MTRHLEDHEISAVAETALGIAEEEVAAHLALPAFLHLAQCAECQAEVEEVSAILAGTPLEASPRNYRSIGFLPAMTPEFLHSDEPFEALAASTEDLEAIAPMQGRMRTLRSADEQIELHVRESLADATCRVYPVAIGSVAPEDIALYMPPGIVCTWPSSTFFRYPRFAYDAVDWTQVQLLYPSQRENPEDSPHPG